MALGADLHLELTLNRAGLKGLTASALNDGLLIIRMYSFLHFVFTSIPYLERALPSFFQIVDIIRIFALCVNAIFDF